MEGKRKFIRVKVRLLTSLVKHDGAFELIEEAVKPTPTLIEVKDISTGSLCLQSECEFLKGTSLELTMPKLKTLDSVAVKCEVTRAEFQDSNYKYEVGLKFIPPNTDYLKQFVEAIKA